LSVFKNESVLYLKHDCWGCNFFNTERERVEREKREREREERERREREESEKRGGGIERE
jgi:hypothetical protein